MRLSDILKKTGQLINPVSRTAASVKPDVPKPERTADIPAAPAPKHEKTQMEGSQIPLAKLQVLSPEETYSRSISEIKSIVEHLDSDEKFPSRIDAVGEISELSEDKSEELAIMANKATPDLYLYSHSVNVCIFAALLGRQLGLKENNLKELSYCSFLHDIGMVKNLNIAQKKGKLTASEYTQIKTHPPKGMELVNMLSHLSPEIKDTVSGVIGQIHERINGGGYPDGLKGKDISMNARIISICDVYEALTHPRPYRDRFIPHEALKMMITSADNDFDTDFLKAFIETVSLYPPGSYVRLNSEELARVVKLNAGLPTRPVVQVIASAKGQKVTENKIVDLAASPFLFIKEAVDETKLELADKKLALELKAVRWWVKSL